MDIESIKIPPHSIESEQSVLGGLLSHNEAWDKIADFLSEADFYVKKHQIIFKTITQILEQNEPADVLTVVNLLRKKKLESKIDGINYLVEITDNTPSISNIKAYAKHVKELSVYRKLIVASSEIMDMAYNPNNLKIAELIDLSEKKIFDISETLTRNKKEVVALKDVIKNVVDHVHEMQGKDIVGLETGFSKLDKITSGLQKGDLIIIAARPSMGKTTLAMNLVEYMATHHSNEPRPVVVFSLEMPTEQLVLRLISSFSHIDLTRVRNGALTDADWQSFNQAVNALENSVILVDETPSITPTEIRAKSRRIKREHPDLALIVVDYLQLMSAQSNAENNRVQEISEISRSLKSLAKELNIPIIALSQLNRGVETRSKENKGRIPQMADLRDSGAIEQDADIIIFIYRDEVYNEGNIEEKGKADIIIAKHRNGPIGSFQLKFDGNIVSFKNLANDDEFSGIDAPNTDFASNNFGHD